MENKYEIIKHSCRLRDDVSVTKSYFRFSPSDKVFDGKCYMKYFEKCAVLNVMINERNMTMTFRARMICDVSFRSSFCCEDPHECDFEKQIHERTRIRFSFLCVFYSAGCCTTFSHLPSGGRNC